MPWKCPACETSIRHRENEDLPGPGIGYRCHICRLELVFDVPANKLIVVPMRDDEPDQKPRDTN